LIVYLIASFVQQRKAAPRKSTFAHQVAQDQPLQLLHFVNQATDFSPSAFGQQQSCTVFRIAVSGGCSLPPETATQGEALQALSSSMPDITPTSVYLNEKFAECV
jgi:hypothetical protein